MFINMSILSKISEISKIIARRKISKPQLEYAKKRCTLSYHDCIWGDLKEEYKIHDNRVQITITKWDEENGIGYDKGEKIIYFYKNRDLVEKVERKFGTHEKRIIYNPPGSWKGIEEKIESRRILQG